jgi:hypothetical protein
MKKYEEAERQKVTKKTAKTGRKAVANGGGKRPPNFNETEDTLLCRAYVSASGSSITGANQKGTTFWKTVASKYNKLAVEEEGGNPKVFTRDDNACKNCWKKLQAVMGKSHKCGHDWQFYANPFQ